MTPLPKRKHSTRRKGKRRAAIKLELVGLVRCTNCKELTRPHMTCPNCGYYKGREMIHYENKKRSKALEADQSR